MISVRDVGRLSLILLLLCGATNAAEPEFKSSVVTASRTYDRESNSFRVAGIPAVVDTVAVSRVTVALDGVFVTGEWEPKTLQSTSAKDFHRGTDVPAAIHRNRLLLQLPDGSVVNAKIVKREKQRPPELDRQTRD